VNSPRLFVCAALLGALGSLLVLSRRPTCPANQITWGPIEELGPKVSPDGSWLAMEYFTPEHPNDPAVWVMPRNGTFADARRVVDDKEYVYAELAWSPDSAWLSAVRMLRSKPGVIGAQIFKINVATGHAIQLTKLPVLTAIGAGTSWSRDGRIAFEMDQDIYTVPSDGDAVTKLVDVQHNLPHVVPYFPVWSPDNTRVAFVGRGGAGAKSSSHDLYVANLRTGEIRRVFAGVGDDGPSWFDDDHILSSREEDGPSSSIWLVSISGPNGVRLTRGHYDMAPTTDITRTYLYFSRNEHISRPSSDEDFHIWKCRLSDGLIR
jgi:Tol biopolymer transport system component